MDKEAESKKQFDLFSLGFAKIREALEITLTTAEAEEAISAFCAYLANKYTGKIFLEE